MKTSEFSVTTVYPAAPFTGLFDNHPSVGSDDTSGDADLTTLGSMEAGLLPPVLWWCPLPGMWPGMCPSSVYAGPSLGKALFSQDVIFTSLLIVLFLTSTTVIGTLQSVHCM